MQTCLMMRTTRKKRREEDENNEDKLLERERMTKTMTIMGWDGPRLQNSKCANVSGEGVV